MTYDVDLIYHILLAIGSKRLDEVGYEDLLALKAGLRAHNQKGERIEARKLSQSKTHDILSRTKEILNLAKKLGRTQREDWRVAKTGGKPGKK